MKSAVIVNLSSSQQAVIAYHPSGKPSLLTLFRGREAWSMSGNEAEKLRAALTAATLDDDE